MTNKRLMLLSTLAAASAMAIIPAVATQAADMVSTDSATWNAATTDYESQSDLNSARSTFGDIYFGTSAAYSGSYVVGGTDVETDADKGVVITDGNAATTEFSGTISGVGIFAVLFGSGKTSTYNFSGDVSGFSGTFYVAPISGTNVLNFSGTSESATSALAGTGSLYSTQSVTFNTAGYNGAATVANSSITANTLTFSGSANYTVNSSLSGIDSSSTLTFSGTGTTTLNGDISNFGTLSVASGATLDISGVSVGLATAIQNSGTVTINSDTVFVLDNWEYTGDWASGATFTLFTNEANVTGLDLSSLTLSNFSSEEIGRTTTISISGATVTFSGADLVWAGTNDNNSWNADVEENTIWTVGEAGSADYFHSSDSVAFSSSATNKNVSVDGDVTAGNVHVYDDYTFALSNGANLTATKLEVNSGSTLTISAGASGSVVTADLEGEGTIVLNGTSSADSDLKSLPTTPDIQLFTTSMNNEARTVEVASGVVLLGATGSEVGDTYSLGTSTTLKIDSGATFVNNNSYLTLANLELSGTFWQIDGARTDDATNNTALTIGTTTVSGSAATIALYWNKKLNLGTLNGDSDATLTILGASAQESDSAGATLATLGDFSGSLVITGRNGSGMVFQLTRSTTDAASMEALTLTNSTLLVYNSDNNSLADDPTNTALTIGQVTVDGSGTIDNTWFQGYFVLNALSGTNATLNLTSQAASSVCAIYELGASVSASATNDFTGTIDISDTNSGSRRSVSLVISNADIAKGAVINFGTEASSDGTLSLGVNVDGATVAGLSSASDHGGTDMIYSGKISPMDVGTNGASIESDDTARTLVVNVAADTSYEFYGIILNNVNITKSGDGSQTIHDSSGRFGGAISVTGGTLTLDGSFAMSALSTTSGATLSLSSGDSSVAATSSDTVSSSGTISIADGASLSISGSSESSLSATIESLAGEGTLSLSDISVSTTQNTQSPFTGSLVLSGSNTAFQLKKGNVTASLASVSLSDSATFALYSSDNNNGVSGTILTIDQVTVSGTGTIETRNYQGHIVINNLSGAEATLNLGSTSTSDVCAVIELGTGISEDATNDFTGTIEISDTATGNNRSLSLVISDGSIASGAVISFGTESATSDSLSLGVNDSTVTVAGLTSANNHNGADIIYSGSVTPTQLGEKGANLSSDSTARTLVINTATDASYDFYGTILANVNLEKTGAGSQAIHGDSSSFNGSVAVEAGTLTLDGAFTLSSASVSSDATLSITGNSTISGALSGAGSLTVSGADVAVEVGSMANYTGTLTIGDGTNASSVKLVGSNAYDNSTTTIVVNAASTLDLNGNSETTFGLTLAGGTLTSSSTPNGDNPRTAKQLPTITLTADSTVNADSGVTFGMLASNYGESDIYLGGNTLTKTGEGTFFLLDTSIYNNSEKGTTSAGTIAVDAGTLELDGVSASAATITVASGAALDVGKSDNYGDSTIGTLTNAGMVTVESAGSLTIAGDSTSTGTLTSSGTLTIADGATLNVSGVTTISGTLTLSGTLEVSGGTTTVSASQEGGNILIDGGQLEVGASVTLSNTITVVLDYYLASEIATTSTTDDTTSYAIVLGENASLGEEAIIVVTASAEFLSSLDAGESYEFDIVSGSYSGAFDYSDLGSGYTVTSDGGVITIGAAPEPSMFGLLAGLGALGFVAARRRRNRKA